MNSAHAKMSVVRLMCWRGRAQDPVGAANGEAAALGAAAQEAAEPNGVEPLGQQYPRHVPLHQHWLLKKFLDGVSRLGACDAT